MRPVLELSRITKRFGDGFALEDVDLDLYPGEVHVVVGENGSGKSALMKLAGGLYGPDSGDLRLEGAEVSFSGEIGRASWRETV